MEDKEALQKADLSKVVQLQKEARTQHVSAAGSKPVIAAAILRENSQRKQRAPDVGPATARHLAQDGYARVLLLATARQLWHQHTVQHLSVSRLEQEWHAQRQKRGWEAPAPGTEGNDEHDDLVDVL